MSINNYNYKNITISGLPGCGSTTLLNKLREELKFDGWKGFSGGEFMRAYAEEKGLFDPTQGGHHSANAYEEDFDRKVDFGIREKLETQYKWIIESWLSGFFAQGVPATLKILMICSEDSVRIDRLINRDNVSVEMAKKNIWDRYNSNLAKWQKIYDKEWQKWVVDTKKIKSGEPIDFWREDLYDLVIDTFKHNKEESLNLVLDAIKKQ